MDKSQQPAPVRAGEIVPDVVIANLQRDDELDPVYREKLITLIQSRDQLGRKKYGQPLMTSDGRCGVQDCLEELGDLLQYATKCKMAGQDTKELEHMIVWGYVYLKHLFADAQK